MVELLYNEFATVFYIRRREEGAKTRTLFLRFAQGRVI
jgi:hypothetical protein